MSTPGTPTPDPAVSGPPPGWETPARTIESYAPTIGPSLNEGSADADYIRAAPAQTVGTTLNDDLASGTVMGAVEIALANYGDRSDRVHNEGHQGDLVAMPDVPDHSWATWGWAEPSGPPVAGGPSHLTPSPGELP
jgi:hypothetical protein